MLVFLVLLREHDLERFIKGISIVALMEFYLRYHWNSNLNRILCFSSWDFPPDPSRRDHTILSTNLTPLFGLLFGPRNRFDDARDCLGFL